MRGMYRALIAALAFVLLLAACGGGDDPTATPPPEPSATSTLEPAPVLPSPTATATDEPATATPTAEPTATRQPTLVASTPRPVATPTPTPTVAPTATPDPLQERVEVLSAALLDERSFPDGWSLGDASVRFEADPQQATLCNLHEFEGRAELIVQLNAQFGTEDGLQFFGQDITEYPAITAFQAMSFARERIGQCPEWTSEDGITFQVEPVLMDLPTSDALSYTLRFSINEMPFEGRWVLIRVNSFVITVVYFAPEGTDPGAMEAALFDVVPRMSVAVNALDEPDYYDDLDLAAYMATQLMSHRETLHLPERWLEYGVTTPLGEQRYNICGLGLFPDEFGALEELQNEFVVDRDAGPFLWQSLSTFEDAEVAAAALAHVRGTVSCTEFPDNAGNIWQVLEYPELPFGDEAHLAHVAYDDGQGGTAQGAFAFVRVGEQITVIVYVGVGEPLDPARVQSIVDVAVQEIVRLR